MPAVSTSDIKKALPIAKKFLSFVNASRSPFHAVEQVSTRLQKQGFQQISEGDSWQQKLKPNGKYFFTKNQSTIVAFAIGGKYKSNGEGGLKIIGAHTDSPDLRLKPVSKRDKNGFLQVGVQTYGGLLAYTWFDRDLTVCGRVIVENPKTGTFESRLVEIKRPIMRIPSLAIHLNREVNSKGFKIDYEEHLSTILSTNIEETVNEKTTTDDSKGNKFTTQHHSILLEVLAEELKCEVKDIYDFELSVVDTQDSVIGGIREEFIFSPRLDNLLSCFCALEGLEDSLDSLDDDSDIRCVVFFDHEEIGSRSAQGADSITLTQTVNRLAHALAGDDTPKDVTDMIINKSFIISADMSHAVHPNYADRHEKTSQLQFHQGPAIKVHCNQRYATNAVTDFLFKTIAERNDIPYQHFVVKQNQGCGSTIGSICAANTGIRTVDIGIPQLSMHSIREMCGTVDVHHTSRLFKVFFEQFRELDNKLKVDM